jgi:hypothetical protein
LPANDPCKFSTWWDSLGVKEALHLASRLMQVPPQLFPLVQRFTRLNLVPVLFYQSPFQRPFVGDSS